MSIQLLFQGKFTEKYFMKFQLPKIQFQPLSGPFQSLLPYEKQEKQVFCFFVFFCVKHMDNFHCKWKSTRNQGNKSLAEFVFNIFNN